MTALHPLRHSAQVLVEQRGQSRRCSRCSISKGVIGGISITWCRQGSGSSPCSKVPQRRQASGWCSTTPATRSIGSSSGPDPGYPGWLPRLRPLLLRRSGGLKPGPSLDGSLEELRQRRTIRSHSSESSGARAASGSRLTDLLPARLTIPQLRKEQRSDAGRGCQPVHF